MDTAQGKFRLSIIVPCYKVEKYLKRCLDSLLAQTLEGLQIICINDGSPDGCIDILNSYKAAHPDIFVIIDRENRGVWRSRREGIEAAEGEYTGFIDPDDHVRADYAKELYLAAKRDRADIACCGYERVEDETGHVYSREMTGFCRDHFDIKKDPGLLTEVNAAPWNKIFRTCLIKDMPDLENIPPALDDMMFAQLMYLKCRRVTFVKKSLIYYTVRQDSIINNISPALVPKICRSMKEVREIYAQKRPGMLLYIDTLAFLHIGISLMYRLYSPRLKGFSRLLKSDLVFLDKNFPGWRNSPYLRASYIASHDCANLRLRIMRDVYLLGLFEPFLFFYTLMIRRLKLDIKW